MTLSDKAPLVIFLRLGTTERQLEVFRSFVLAPAGRENDLPSFVGLYWRLAPGQANGHWGVALTFKDEARPEEATGYVERIKRDSRVDNVYLDVPCTALDPAHRPDRSWCCWSRCVYRKGAVKPPPFRAGDIRRILRSKTDFACIRRVQIEQ
jgi:hypothetical protein